MYDILNKNEKINVFYSSKKTKFWVKKYYNQNNYKLINNKNSINIIKTISDGWLINNQNNSRYQAYITLFYFNISNFVIKNKKILENKLLVELNDKIINLMKK